MEKNSKVNLTSVNYEKFRKVAMENKRLSSQNCGLKKVVVCLAFAVVTSGIVGGAVGYNSVNKEVIIPDGYITTNLEMSIHKETDISDIADTYYDDLYAGVYKNEDNYINSMKDTNKLRSDRIPAGTTIKIPVIFDANNEHYLRITDLQTQIEELAKNNYWVPYTVKFGDSLSFLAAQASGSEAETVELVNSIKNKNGKSSANAIQEGETIYIVNPELGPLKKELEQEKQWLLLTTTAINRGSAKK